MKTSNQTKQVEAAPVLVPAKTIGTALSCTARYVHILHETGKIPGHRFGKGCIRFNQAAVFEALGINTERVRA